MYEVLNKITSATVVLQIFAERSIKYKNREKKRGDFVTCLMSVHKDLLRICHFNGIVLHQ